MAGNIEAHKAKQEETKEEDDRPLAEFGIIAVSSGPGLDEIFRELGVGEIVSGGQTMNPSTADFVEAIKRIHAENVYILPNNSNIVMAASQACEVLDPSINAKVVPSKTIPQGIASLMQFNPDNDPETIFQEMKSALKSVLSGSVTYAIKDTDIDGVHITKDYYMAMEDKKIVSCVKSRKDAILDLIESMMNEDAAVLTVYCGADVDEAEREEVEGILNEKYGEDVEIDVRDGGQPVYSYLVGLE
jgi:dihydroxyacetone kinase-like predicted kinase